MSPNHFGTNPKLRQLLLFLLLATLAIGCRTTRGRDSTLPVWGDHYFNGDQRVEVEIAADRIGIAVTSDTSMDDVKRQLDQFQIQSLTALDRHIHIARLPATKSKAELLALVRQVRGSLSALGADTGIVARPTTAHAPFVVTDDIIVEFKSGVSEKRKDEIRRQVSADVVEKIPFEKEMFVVRVSEGAAQANPALDAFAVSRAYQSFPEVDYSHPDFIIPTRPRAHPNDPLYHLQWHLHNTGQNGGTEDADIDAPQAWDFSVGSDVVIAIIDYGCDLDHADLVDNLWANPGEIADNGVDDDGNNFIDDVNGWNFSNWTNRIPPEDHGTAVAGCAGARGDNRRGISGSSQVCRLMTIVLGSKVSRQVAAFGFARTRGADVINASWGFDPGVATPAALATAIERAADLGRDNLGCVITWAMTNLNLDNCDVDVPDISSDDKVIAVSIATNRDTAGKAGYGDCMDVLAPSHRGTLSITTTDVTGRAGYNNATPIGCSVVEFAPPPADARSYTQCFNGTSAAAPITAGVAALILSLDPSLTRLQVQRLLQDTCDKVEPSAASYGVRTAFSSSHGYGRINAFEAARIVAQGDGGLGGVDVFVRDNRLDWGNTEQPSTVTFEPVRGYIPHWATTDIKVDAPPYQTAPTSSQQFDAMMDENPRQGSVSRVYVRVRNRGPKTAESVRIKAYWTEGRTSLPPLPADFWTSETLGDTTAWSSLGTREVTNLVHSGATVAGTAFDLAQIVAFDWDVPTDEESSVNKPYCIFAVIDSPQDPVSEESKASLDPDFITPRDNNVTQRNVLLQGPLDDGQFVDLEIFINNWLEDRINTRVRIVDLPEYMYAETEGITPGGYFEMRSEEERSFRARFHALGSIDVGEFHILQEVVTPTGAQLVKGFSIRLPGSEIELRPIP